MSLSSENMMKLMAYADGELEGDGLAEVEKLLAKEPDAARFVADMANLGAYVSEGHDERDAKAVAKFDVADVVMAKVKDVPASSIAPPAKVVSLAEAKKKRTNVVAIGGAVVAALALAASIFLWNRPQETPMARAPKPTPPTASQLPGVEVDTADSPGQKVEVFYGPGANDMQTSVVIWVDDTVGEKK